MGAAEVSGPAKRAKGYKGPDRRNTSQRLTAVEAGLKNHEDRCDLRYQGIEANTETIKARLNGIEGSLKGNTDTTNRIWWAVTVGGGAVIVFLAKLAFSA